MAALIEDTVGCTSLRSSFGTHSMVWALLVLGVAALWPTLSALGRIWLTVADYQHGFAIAAISAVWLFRVHGRIDAADVRATPLALPALGLAIFVWMIAYRANSELMQQLIAPIILLLAMFAAFGLQVARRVAAPLAYLYFAIPLWEHFVPLLQWLTTHVAEAVLGFMSVPTQVEGNNVTIPAGQFSIIEGCSGKRYFVIGLAFAVLAGVAQRVRGRRMFMLLAAAAATALVTNWLRVVIVIYAGHVSNMQHYLVATEHKSLGYLLFAPMLLVISLVARRLGDDSAIDATRAVSASRGARVGAGWITPAILLVAPVLVWALPMSADEIKPVLRPLPIMTGAWQGPLPPGAEWRPEFVAPADESRASYLGGPHRIEVYLNSYGAQAPGRELIYHRNSVAPANWWTMIRWMPRTGSAPPAVIAVNQIGARWVIAHQYVVAGRVTSEAALAQLYYGINAVFRPAPGGVIAVATPCIPDCDAAADRLNNFWTDNGVLFADMIPRTL
ncbi:MAG: exosortase C-terminal domain/associated protein EpsI [Steroidobacter sp.]